jgi:excisionase family DNA binding protein
MSNSNNLKLLNLRDTAELLNLGLSTVRRWASSGRIPTVRLGGRVLVLEEDLKTLISKCRRPARPDIAV